MNEHLLVFSLLLSIAGCNAVAVRSSHQSDICFEANLLELKCNLVWEQNTQDKPELPSCTSQLQKLVF